MKVLRNSKVFQGCINLQTLTVLLHLEDCTKLVFFKFSYDLTKIKRETVIFNQENCSKSSKLFDLHQHSSRVIKLIARAARSLISPVRMLKSIYVPVPKKTQFLVFRSRKWIFGKAYLMPRSDAAGLCWATCDPFQKSPKNVVCWVTFSIMSDFG